MARFCFCDQAVFRTDKNTNIGYCRNHYRQFSTDLDNRSIAEKALDKHRKQSSTQKVRSLTHIKGDEKEFLDSRNNLLNELDFYTSRIVRLMATDSEGICTCYICHSQGRWQDYQCAHFNRRSLMSTRFDIRFNLRANCKTCNEYKGGNLEMFAEELKKEMGEDIIETIQAKGREIWKPSNDELSQLLSDYKQRLKILEQKLKK